MKKSYLDFYYRCMNSGRLPFWGLCGCFPKDELLALIDPERGKGETYWAYERSDDEDWNLVHHDFTPLRQTIVLLMAAMNGEL